tara:strand:+ start:168 stop:782 length:615 start_codon:yes stop_codon:yes gene_type:complete
MQTNEQVRHKPTNPSRSAKVNLVFDQIVYLISDEMFKHFKNASSSLLLDDNYKATIVRGKTDTKNKNQNQSHNKHSLSISERRFQIPANQRHIMLLGRSVDLNFLISSHINKVMQKDIDVAIKRMQSMDISNVLEFEMMLSVLKLTHERLSKILLGLDTFEDLFKSSNADVNATQRGGKVAAWVNESVLNDVITNYSYNAFTQR